MEKVRFGKTELLASRTGFGAIPIQRISEEDAISLLRQAYEGGINIYDTARAYSDSEIKIGKALSDVRKDIILSSKTLSRDRDNILKDIETSLKNLQTDYVDIYQIHNPGFVPKQGDEVYEAFAEIKRQGMIKHIGFTNHSLEHAINAAKSGLFDTIQYPLSPLSTPEEFGLVALCKELDLGYFAMKALAGGIITNAITSFVTLRQYENVIPIWGMQTKAELEEILSFENNPPEMTEEIKAIINKDREELSGSFCRGCGYCQPCPAEIPIELAAKITHSIFRMRKENFFTEEWREKMDRIKNCIHCNHCIDHCPYGLDTPSLLAAQLEYYDVLYDRHSKGLPLKG